MYDIKTITRKRSTQKYVYTLSRPDGTVFYVGKGTGNRIHQHESFTRQGKRSACATVIRQIWADGGQVGKAVLFVTDNPDEALDEERRLISHVGLENLVNILPGGSGGVTPCDEVRRLIAERMKGRKFTVEHRAKISAALKGRPLPLEQRAKLSADRLGKPGHPWSDAARKKASESRRAFWQKQRDEGNAALFERMCDSAKRMAEANIGRKMPPEFGRAISERKTGVSRPEEMRQKLSASKRLRSRIAPHVPDIRAKRTAGVKLRDIAAEFGISEAMVSLIYHRKLYGDIE